MNIDSLPWGDRTVGGVLKSHFSLTKAKFEFEGEKFIECEYYDDSAKNKMVENMMNEANLSPEERKIFWCAHKGYSNQEIGDIIGAPHKDSKKKANFIAGKRLKIRRKLNKAREKLENAFKLRESLEKEKE